MDEILFLLLKKGAYQKQVHLTTTQIGLELGMSQQNASHRILSLENEGYIERTKGSQIKLTKKGIDELSSFYAILKSAFEGQKIEISGRITSGLGEGKYYLSLAGYRKQVRAKLGFDPYPGTLNLSLDDDEIWKRQFILQLDPIIINGFKDGERTYGDLFAYRCKIDAGDLILATEGAIVVPLRTHHPQNIFEIIAPVNLKEKFRKKNGELMRIRI